MSGAIIRVRVQPGASRDRIVGRLGDAIKIAVTAPPEKGRANKAACKLLAGILGVAASDVQVVAGLTSRSKKVRVAGMTAAHIAAALAALVETP